MDDMRSTNRPLTLLVIAGVLATASACGTPGDDVTAQVRTPAVSDTTPDAALPGDPIDPMFVPEGAELGAVAIAFDETLDVRELPGAEQPVVASLPPLAMRIVSNGRAQNLGPGDTWLEVTVESTVGWAPLRNLLYIGGTSDETARYESLLGGATTAPTMLALGQLVADAAASDDPEVTSRVVVVVAPTDGPTGEVTFDVVDFADDSIGGLRLVVTGVQQPVDGTLPPTAFARATVYELAGVESTLLCLRGVDTDGLCI